MLELLYNSRFSLGGPLDAVKQMKRYVIEYSRQDTSLIGKWWKTSFQTKENEGSFQELCASSTLASKEKIRKGKICVLKLFDYLNKTLGSPKWLVLVAISFVSIGCRYVVLWYIFNMILKKTFNSVSDSISLLVILNHWLPRRLCAMGARKKVPEGNPSVVDRVASRIHIHNEAKYSLSFRWTVTSFAQE